MRRLLRDLEPRTLWWRALCWAALTVVTVLSTHSATSRVVAGVSLGLASIALVLLRHPSLAVKRGAVAVATIGGLAACLAAHDGVAEVAVAVAATRLPEVADGAVLRWLVVLDTIAFGGTVGFLSRSAAGALAGVAIPLLVQRAIEHRDLIRERDRAQALLIEVQAGRDAEAQAATLQERGRIARELHDVLAHSLAGLSVQLQAVRAVAGREGAGPAVLEPLDKAAALARSGLGEARAAVSALRDPVGLGVGDLPSLVDRYPGTAVLHVEGEPGPLPPETGHAIYRAVQEALTNAARYAPGSAVAVTLRWSPDELAVEVADDGPGQHRQAVPDQGTGLGLAGMAERLGHVGGTMQAGPRPDGGWQVQLRAPVRAPQAVDR